MSDHIHQIEQQDELPTTICGQCVDRSLDAYDFIQVVIQAQNIFTGKEMKPTIPANRFETQSDLICCIIHIKFMIHLPNLNDSIKYGTTTISSAGSQINVNPPRIPKKTKKMNMSEALKKLKNIGSHITISKKVVSAEEAHDESSDDDNLDNDYEPVTGGASDSDSNNANSRNIRKTIKSKSSTQMKKKKKRTNLGPRKSKYSVKVDGPPGNLRFNSSKRYNSCASKYFFLLIFR